LYKSLQAFDLTHLVLNYQKYEMSLTELLIRIEPFEAEDFNRLIAWIESEEDLIQFAGPLFVFPLTVKQLASYLSDPNRKPFKVIRLDGNKVIGHAELYFGEDSIVKLCRILIGDKNYRRKGYGQQIVNELLKLAFSILTVRKAELNVFDWNISAIKCYEKVGFVKNEKISKVTLVKGNKWISINMSLNRIKWNQLIAKKQ
jgi:RimJ/RimL family protein N-acetyltransferase